MKHLCTIILLVLNLSSFGQSITGQWISYDDDTQQPKAVLEIYEIDNHYFAKIVDSFISDSNAVCEKCKGDKKRKPIIGLVIMENIKKTGSEFSGGTILDPENGKTYKCKLKLLNDNELSVRGYIGLSLIGRSQKWTKKK